jgi:flagellar protein FlaI
MAAKKTEEENPVLEENEEHKVVKENGSISYVMSDIYLGRGGLASLNELINDEAIEEIMYNDPNKPVEIMHRNYKSVTTNINITSSDALKYIIQIAAYNKKIITEASPLLDGVLPNGSRINATVPPATPFPTFTIRKFSHETITMAELMNEGVLDAKTAATLWTFIEGLGHKPVNMLIAGGTATGKTTFLNALLMLVPNNQRIITIEDTAELRILHHNRVAMFADKEKNITMDMLLKNSLRMRPDRIIVGEVRGPEAMTMFSAMNTGHNGCMGTLHASSAREVVTRITNPPMSVPISMLKDLNLIVLLERINDKRVVSEITEVELLSGNQVSFNPIYKYNPAKGVMEPTGIPSRLRTRIAEASGIEIKQFDSIIADRTNIMWLVAGKKKEFTNISSFDIFDLFRKNQEHWKKFKGNKKWGFIKRKEEELIDW